MAADEKNAILMGCTCGKIDLEQKIVILTTQYRFQDMGNDPRITLPTQARVMFKCRSCNTTNDFETVNIEYREQGDA